MAFGMNYKGLIELQLRQALDRLILVEPSEQPRYLEQIAKISGELLKEKQFEETKDPFEQIWER